MANLYCSCGNKVKEIPGEKDQDNGICDKCTKETAVYVLKQAIAHIEGHAYPPRTNNGDAMELIANTLGIK